MSSMRTMAKSAEQKPCLRACWEERALPSGERGPVERAALRRLASSCLGETGFFGMGHFLREEIARGGGRVRKGSGEVLGNRRDILVKRVAPRGQGAARPALPFKDNQLVLTEIYY